MGMSSQLSKIAPSILSADFTRIEHAINEISHSGADWIHCDVMDGHFVPNLTFGPKMIQDIRKRTDMFLDVHVMIEKPENSADAYIDSGASALTFHIEACTHAHRLLNHIRSRGILAGIALVPSTPVSAISELIHDLDIVLVMSVNPGFGGQKFISQSLQKIRQLAEMRLRTTASYQISVDGGVNRDTAPHILTAGADILIAGNAFFSAQNKEAEVAHLRGVL